MWYVQCSCYQEVSNIQVRRWIVSWVYISLRLLTVATGGSFRMNNLRHNPYVGSFHGKSFAMLSGNYYEFMHVIHEKGTILMVQTPETWTIMCSKNSEEIRWWGYFDMLLWAAVLRRQPAGLMRPWGGGLWAWRPYCTSTAPRTVLSWSHGSSHSPLHRIVSSSRCVEYPVECSLLPWAHPLQRPR